MKSLISCEHIRSDLLHGDQCMLYHNLHFQVTMGFAGNAFGGAVMQARAQRWRQKNRWSAHFQAAQSTVQHAAAI